MSYSLARKVQYSTALRLLKAEGLKDQIQTLKTKNILLKDQVLNKLHRTDVAKSNSVSIKKSLKI